MKTLGSKSTRMKVVMLWRQAITRNCCVGFRRFTQQIDSVKENYIPDRKWVLESLHTEQKAKLSVITKLLHIDRKRKL